MRSRLLFSAALALAACEGSIDTTGTQNTGPVFAITGNDMSARGQNVYITLNGAGDSLLTVTANGTTLPSVGGGQYFGTLPATLVTGDTLQLIVTDGSYTATGRTVIPAAPTITSATVASHGAPVVVSWSVASSPDSFLVSLNYHLPDNSAAAVSARLGGGARQVTLSQANIPANGVVYSINLQATMTGTFTGAAASGSRMNVRAEAPSYPFTVP